MVNTLAIIHTNKRQFLFRPHRGAGEWITLIFALLLLRLLRFSPTYHPCPEQKIFHNYFQDNSSLLPSMGTDGFGLARLL